MRSPDACVSLRRAVRPLAASSPVVASEASQIHAGARCKAGVARRGSDQTAACKLPRTCAQAGSLEVRCTFAPLLPGARTQPVGSAESPSPESKFLFTASCMRSCVLRQPASAGMTTCWRAWLLQCISKLRVSGMLLTNQVDKAGRAVSCMYLRLTLPSRGRLKASGFAPPLMSNVRPNSNLWIFPNVALGSHLSPVPPTSPFRMVVSNGVVVSGSAFVSLSAKRSIRRHLQRDHSGPVVSGVAGQLS